MQASPFSPQADGPRETARGTVPSTASGQESDVATLGLALAHAVLERVLIGVGVVDSSLNVLYANAAARNDCRRSTTMHLDAAGLRIDDPKRHAELLSAAAAASRGRWSLVHLPGEATTLAVVPLPTAEGTPGSSLVLVVFGLRQQTRTLAIEFFARAQGMTLAETRVLCAIAEGLSPKQIASRHAVALSTIRSQISSIRERAGAHSIVALIRTLAELPPIMAAASTAA